MHSDLFDTAQPVESSERFTLQNPHLLKVTLGPDVIAAKGSMVAFQGHVNFEHKSSGSLGKMLRRIVTSEDTPLMRVSGRGDVYFADHAKSVSLIDLDDEALSVSGANLLAFDDTLAYDVHRVRGLGVLAGGMFNTLVHGTGRVAITTEGQPVILDASRLQVCVDIDAVVCWSATLQPTIRSSVNVKSMLRGGTGEAFQYVFTGEGFVVVQPSEAPRRPATNGTSAAR